MNSGIKLLFLILVLSSFFSCTQVSVQSSVEHLKNVDDNFLYTDKTGEYDLKVSSSLNQKDKKFITKRSLNIIDKKSNNSLEQSISISDVGKISNKTFLLRPNISQYNVWFEGKKYFVELKILTKEKAVNVRTISPEKQWNGNKTIKFPSTTMPACFFTQVMDCARITGFIEKSIKDKKGSMSLLILWEGYPFINQTFSDFPVELFSEGVLQYDGKLNENETRFNLRVAGQSIVYILNKKRENAKMFWITQGISMINKNDQREIDLFKQENFE